MDGHERLIVTQHSQAYFSESQHATWQAARPGTSTFGSTSGGQHIVKNCSSCPEQDGSELQSGGVVNPEPEVYPPLAVALAENRSDCESEHKSGGVRFAWNVSAATGEAAVPSSVGNVNAIGEFHNAANGGLGAAVNGVPDAAIVFANNLKEFRDARPGQHEAIAGVTTATHVAADATNSPLSASDRYSVVTNPNPGAGSGVQNARDDAAKVGADGHCDAASGAFDGEPNASDTSIQYLASSTLSRAIVMVDDTGNPIMLGDRTNHNLNITPDSTEKDERVQRELWAGGHRGMAIALLRNNGSTPVFRALTPSEAVRSSMAGLQSYMSTAAAEAVESSIEDGVEKFTVRFSGVPAVCPPIVKEVPTIEVVVDGGQSTVPGRLDGGSGDNEAVQRNESASVLPLGQVDPLLCGVLQADTAPRCSPWPGDASAVRTVQHGMIPGCADRDAGCAAGNEGGSARGCSIADDTPDFCPTEPIGHLEERADGHTIVALGRAAEHTGNVNTSDPNCFKGGGLVGNDARGPQVEHANMALHEEVRYGFLGEVNVASLGEMGDESLAEVRESSLGGPPCGPPNLEAQSASP
jgi:hypothetical protein